MNQQKIGNFIKEKRKEKNLTQDELASKLGVSNRTISKWENGHGLPDYSLILELCKVLDMSINELLSGEEVKEENYRTMLEENIIKAIDYNNKKRNKKNIVITIFVVLIIILGLTIFYKNYLVSFYTDDATKIISNISEKELNRNDKANTEVLNGVSMYVPEGYRLLTSRDEFMYVEVGCALYASDNFSKTEEGYVGSFFKICPEELNFTGFETINDTLFDKFNTGDLFIKNNIYSYYDLYKYYMNNKDNKYNIFTRKDDLRMMYTNLLLTPTNDKTYLYSGNIKGVSFINYRDNKFAYADTHFSLTDGHDYYLSVFNLRDGNLSENDIIDMLSSIKSSYN